MIVKVSMSLLKKLLFEADTAAPATEQPQQTDDEKFKQQVAELNSAAEGATIPGQDKKFVKKGSDWYIADVQLSADDLLSLISDEMKDSVKKVLDKAPNSITIKGDQFIGGGTQKAATFVKLGNGDWEDQTPVPMQILAQYIVLPESTAPFEADISGPSGTKPLVYKQDELMIVIDRNEMFVMSTSGNQNDPLGATYNFLEKTGMLTNFTDVGAARKGFLGTGGKITNTDKLVKQRESLLKFLKTDDTSGDFIDVPMSKLNLGDLTKAIGKSRTLAGKLGDVFTGANVKMNFTFSRFGPALQRSLVVGGRKGKGGGGALSSADVKEIIATQLFREEELPQAGQGDYVVTIKDLIVPANSEEGGVPERSLRVTDKGRVFCSPEITYIGSMNAGSVSTFADAFFIYLNGLVKIEAAAPAQAPLAARTVVQAGTSPSKPADGVAVGGPNSGAAFFVFDKSNQTVDVDKNDSDEYIKMVIAELEKAGAVSVTVIGTADVKGNDADNTSLSLQRAQFLVNKMNKTLTNLKFTALGVGEVPYTKDQDANEQTRTFQRYAKVYYGKLEQPAAVKLASEFTQKIAGSVTESAELQEIRLQIRKLLRSR